MKLSAHNIQYISQVIASLESYKDVQVMTACLCKIFGDSSAEFSPNQFRDAIEKLRARYLVGVCP